MLLSLTLAVKKINNYSAFEYYNEFSVLNIIILFYIFGKCDD